MTLDEVWVEAEQRFRDNWTEVWLWAASVVDDVDAAGRFRRMAESLQTPRGAQ